MQREVFTAEEMSVIAAIHSDPKSDAPRLAYAAWLEAHGAPEQAEFIRLQCQKPYVQVLTRDPARRCADPRLLALYPLVHRFARHEMRRSLHSCEEYVRGLPLVQTGNEDYTPEADSILLDVSPLARLDLWLRTGSLADWLAHPVMNRVDRLVIWPKVPHEKPMTQEEDDAWGYHLDEIWKVNIRALAASPVLERLDELSLWGLGAGYSYDLSKELLEPRVHVEYGY